MFTTEQEVLFRLLRGELTSLPEGTDADRLLQMFQRHRLMPLSSAVREQLPEEQQEQWKKLLQQKTLHSLQLSAETARLIQLLKQEGVVAIPLKGSVLAQMLYGDVGLRHCNDIDLLINRADIDRTARVLTGCGYSQSYPRRLTPRQERIYARYKKDVGFYNREQRMFIELHYGIYVHELLRRADEPAIRDATERVELHNEALVVFDRATTFIYLVYHGCLHQFFRLFWLRDVAEALQQWELDHAKILEKMRSLGLERMAGIALLLAERWFAAEVPEPYRELVSENKAVQRLAARCEQRILGPELPGPGTKLNRHLYLFGLKPGARYKWAVLWSILQRWRIRKFMGGH
ncbi:MAG: nucleotidyltransferase family protein [Bacteroidales bacterium]|nr:nucleotidyltransferase family protein [Bacteroidales bacterium]